MKNHHLHDIRGERKEQLLILVDKNGKKIGKETRGVCHAGEGKTHLAFMAFIFANDKIVLAKRSRKKSLWAGFRDASVVSHVLADETIEQAAKRRGKEEMGVDVDFKDLGSFYYFAKHGESAENEYCHVMVGQTTKQITPNSVEIEEVKNISIEELRQDIKVNSKEYTPWIKIALNKINLERYS